MYVTDDGAEKRDLDLGHYERFTHAKLTRDSHIGLLEEFTNPLFPRSAAAITWARPCKWIPHVTDEIKAAFRKIMRRTRRCRDY